jgi:hypothetical protein
MNRCSHHLRRCEGYKFFWICELVLGAGELGLSKSLCEYGRQLATQ